MALQSRNSGRRLPTYQPRTYDSVKERAERRGGRYDSPVISGVDTFTPKVGDNPIRFLQPTWEPHEHYAFSVWMHQQIGQDKSSYICLRKMQNKKCPICEAEQESRRAGETDEAKALAPVEKFWSWIHDRKDPDVLAKVYINSWTGDQNLAKQCIDKVRGKVLLIDHPDKGYDIVINRVGQGLLTKYAFIVDREPSPVSDDDKRQEEILEFIMDNPIPDQMHFYDYTYLKNVLSGGAEEKDTELDDKEDNSRPDVAARERREEEQHEAQEARQSLNRVRHAPAAEEEPARSAQRPAARRAEVVEEEEVAEAPRRPAPAARRPAPADERYDEETGEIEEPAPRRPTAPARPATRAAQPADDEFFDGTAEDEERPAPRGRPASSTERVRNK